MDYYKAENDTLLSLMTYDELAKVKDAKLKREARQKQVLKDSGVKTPPYFHPSVYHIEDFPESYRAKVRQRADQLHSIDDYLRRDDKVASYPTSIGAYLPATATSPIYKTIEILTTDDGRLKFTKENALDLQDMLNFVKSSENKGYKLVINSKRALASNVVFLPDKAPNSLKSEADALSKKQLEAVLELVDVGGVVDDSYRAPRYVASAGKSFEFSSALNSPFHIYNNVVLLYLEKEADKPPPQKETPVEEERKKSSELSSTTSLMPVSGVNIQVVFEFPANDVQRSVYLYMPDMITISHSVHRARIPISTLGSTTITGVGLGGKMVAGSIIKMFNRRDSFQAYIKLFVEERYEKMKKERLASLLSLESNISMNELSDYMLDDLAPFNIHLISMSETDCVYKDPPKVDSILGCMIINTGKVYSIENLITEETMSFIAKTVIYQDDLNTSIVKTLPSEHLTTGSALLRNLR